MGVIGGRIGYSMLKGISRRGRDLAAGAPAVSTSRAGIPAFIGGLKEEIQGKVVIDFGCGEGQDSVHLARLGARKVIGVDIQERFLERARARAEREGLGSVCEFVSAPREQADGIVCKDAFEHFADVPAVLEDMDRMLKPEGSVFACFGPTWYHPYGGHLFSVFPWAHLIFTEKALVRWRSDFKDDGAKRISEVAGGLNRMTIRRFVRIVKDSPFDFAEFETVSIRALRFFHSPLTREITTAIVRCRLVKKSFFEGPGRESPA